MRRGCEAKEARKAEKRSRQGRSRREEETPGYGIFLGLYLTPLSHGVAIAPGTPSCHWLPIMPPQLPEVLPLTRHSQTNRRSSTAHVVPSRFILGRLASASSLFPPSPPRSSHSVSLPLSFTLTAAPLFPPLLPYPLPAQKEREREREGERARARARARERTPSLTRAAFRSRFPSLALTRLPRTLVAASPSSRSRVAHPIPTPYTLDVERRPSPAGGRRASASPSRITPRPRERSVTTKVLVKS